MEERKAWDRLPGESAKAFEAFTAYCRQAARARSIEAAYQSTVAASEQGKRVRSAPRRWYTWSSDHSWVLRAAAYDEYLAEEDRLLWEERRKRLKERDWDQAEALRQIVEDALPHAERFLRQSTVTVPGDPQRGTPERQIITVQFDIAALTRVLVEASKLQRLATDEPTDNINHLSGAALDAAIERELARRVAELAHPGETGDAQAADAEADSGVEPYQNGIESNLGAD